MNGVDPLNQSLYFAAAASSQTNTKPKKDEKPFLKKKVSFRSALEKSIERESLISNGMPLEIIGMPEEDAIVFLKDAVDAAGDELIKKMTADAFSNYRSAIRQFMVYIEKKNFEIEKFKRRCMRSRRSPKNSAVQIRIINAKLDKLASDLLYNHADKLKLLAKVDEINGLIVDLLAA